MHEIQTATLPHTVAAARMSKDTLLVIQSHKNYNGAILNNLNRNADEMNALNTNLIRYCKHGTASEVSAMLEDGAKCINDNGGDTLLHIAYSSEKERLKKFDILVKHNPSMINSKNKKRRNSSTQSCDGGR